MSGQKELDDLRAFALYLYLDRKISLDQYGRLVSLSIDCYHGAYGKGIADYVKALNQKRQNDGK